MSLHMKVPEDSPKGFKMHKVVVTSVNQVEGGELPSSSSLESLFNSLFTSAASDSQAASPAQEAIMTKEQEWFQKCLSARD
jgi:hypothetical protein